MTREKLVQSACTVFAAEGYHPTTIDRVADVAGVAKGTLYQYFRSKSELYEACLERLASEFDRLVAELRTASTFEGVNNADDFRRRLGSINQVFIKGLVEKAELMSLYQASSTQTEGAVYKERLGPRMTELRRALDVLIQNAKNRGWIRNPTASRDLSIFVLASYQGLFMLNFQREGAPAEAGASQLLDQYVDFLARALEFSEA